MEKNEIYALLNEIDEVLTKKGISVGNVGYDEEMSEIYITIERGDWKHDHLYADRIMEQSFGRECIREETTETDGSDTYSSEHRYRLTGVRSSRFAGIM